MLRRGFSPGLFVPSGLRHIRPYHGYWRSHQEHPYSLLWLLGTSRLQPWLHIIPLARSDDQIRPVHLDLNPAVLVRPCIIRNAVGDLILEKITLCIAPRTSVNPSNVRETGSLCLFRPYPSSPERRHGLNRAVVKYREVPRLKIRDTLAGRRRNYNIETNASGGQTTFRGLSRKRRRNTKRRCPQNANDALVDKHKLTPPAESPASNCMPDQMGRGPISSQGIVAQSNFQSTTNLLTAKVKWNRHQQSGARRTAPFNASI